MSNTMTKIVEGNEVTPAVGSLVKLDGRMIAECLLPGDAPVDSGYRGCDFRYPINSGLIKSVAVNVEVTGRTLQRLPYEESYWVRVRITFVGDCEADTETKGWMLVR
jgi:hypothetical protein